jgi:hypothetical protein
MVWEYNTALNTDAVKDLKGVSEEDKFNLQVMALGITSEVGNTQVNRTQVNVGMQENMQYDSKGMPVFDNKDTRAKVAQVGAHEDLHTGGLRHENDPKNSKTIVDQQKKDAQNGVKDGGNGTNVLPIQRSDLIKRVEEQQPKTN